MDPLREQLPLQPSRVAGRRDDLAVDQAGLGQQRAARGDEFGEVARQRLGAARADLDIGAVPGDEGTVR